MMRVLDDNVRARFRSVANDAFVKRVVPDSARLDDDPFGAQRFGKRLEMLFVILDDFVSRFSSDGESNRRSPLRYSL